MGYMKIPSLYQLTAILDLFKEVVCSEKIHGSSARISYKDGEITFSSGGAKHEEFVSIFNAESLKADLSTMVPKGTDVVIFGEAYGGRVQGREIAKVYGDKLRFIVFEVKFGGSWLNTEKAEKFATRLGLDFVPYKIGPATIEFVNTERDAPSEVAKRNGMGDDKWREGVVIRPLIELTMNNGQRLIAKHRRERETKTERELDPAQLKILNDAQEIAEEWVTVERLHKVLQKLGFVEGGENIPQKKDTGNVIKGMVADVRAESGLEKEINDVPQEIVWSVEVEKAIGSKTQKLFFQELFSYNKAEEREVEKDNG